MLVLERPMDPHGHDMVSIVSSSDSSSKLTETPQCTVVSVYDVVCPFSTCVEQMCLLFAVFTVNTHWLSDMFEKERRLKPQNVQIRMHVFLDSRTRST